MEPVKCLLYILKWHYFAYKSLDYLLSILCGNWHWVTQESDFKPIIFDFLFSFCVPYLGKNPHQLQGRLKQVTLRKGIYMLIIWTILCPSLEASEPFFHWWIAESNLRVRFRSISLSSEFHLDVLLFIGILIPHLLWKASLIVIVIMWVVFSISTMNLMRLPEIVIRTVGSVLYVSQYAFGEE